ncbi:MAG: tryptophan-rich sensory protein [Clostridia bacterium]|nr:tryptophan-rich sensory protein [Clostridia bacterium]
MKKKNITVYLLSILLVAVVAGVGGWVTAKGMPAYDLVQKPLLTPPAIVFPIVWSVLYLLMAIGSAMIFLSPDSLNRDRALVAYMFQLAANLIWSFLFFGFGLYGLAFFWLLLLIALVVLMILKFYSISKVAALIQLPYSLWLLLAAYLNLSVFLLNR